MSAKEGLQISFSQENLSVNLQRELDRASSNIVCHRYFPVIEKFCQFLETDKNDPQVRGIINDLHLVVFLEGYLEAEIIRHNPDDISDDGLDRISFLDGIGKTIMKTRMLCSLIGEDSKFDEKRLNDFCEQLAVDGLYDLREIEIELRNNLEELMYPAMEMNPNWRFVEEIWDVTTYQKEEGIFQNLNKSQLSREELEMILSSIGASEIFKKRLLGVD